MTIDHIAQALRDSAWVGIGSVATFFAAVVALGAIVADRRQRASDERKRQARAISGWITRVQVAMPEDG